MNFIHVCTKFECYTRKTKLFDYISGNNSANLSLHFLQNTLCSKK